MDLVETAGVDVSDWSNCVDGVAARNPKYCYEWAFIEPKKLVVLNVWHDHLAERDNGSIYVDLNLS